MKNMHLNSKTRWYYTYDIFSPNKKTLHRDPSHTDPLIMPKGHNQGLFIYLYIFFTFKLTKNIVLSYIMDIHKVPDCIMDIHKVPLCAYLYILLQFLIYSCIPALWSVSCFQDVNDMITSERPNWQTVYTYVTSIYCHFETWTFYKSSWMQWASACLRKPRGPWLILQGAVLPSVCCLPP